MINKGDFVVCTEDVYHYHTNELRFQKGKFYEVKSAKFDEFQQSWRLKLTPEDGDVVCVVKLGYIFITLAEWRDKQIDSILEYD